MLAWNFLSPTWIVSQNTINTEGVYITYERLGEFAKLIQYKAKVDSLLVIYENELRLKDSIIENTRQQVAMYEAEVVPNMLAQLQVVEQQRSADQRQYGLEVLQLDQKLQKAKRRRWGLGLLAGLGVGGQGTVQPVIGAGISFNLLKF